MPTVSVMPTPSERKSVTVSPCTDTASTGNAVPAPRLTVNAEPGGAERSFSASLHVRVTADPFTDAPETAGLTPSTRCPASSPNAAWVRTAATLPSPALVIVPPLGSSAFAPMAMPSASASFSATT